MKRSVFAAAVATLLLALLTASSATAADLVPYGQPVPARGAFWQGPYVGANLGYQWGTVSNFGADSGRTISAG